MSDKLNYEEILISRCSEHANEAIMASKIAKEMKLDAESLDACLLFYPYIEEKLTEEELELTGKDVIELILSLKKLFDLKFNTKSDEAENIRKMFFAISKDVRVILIKLSFVMAKLKDIERLNASEQKNFASLVLEIFAPLANRLGLSVIKSELENRAFKVLKTEMYEKIEKELNEKLKQSESIINNITIKLQTILDELGIEGRITGRKKHIYSIYKKILNKNTSLNEIYDLFAVRTIMKSIPDCYALIGRVSSEFTPIQNRYKDYIAIPKSNGYQSIHTTVMFKDFPVEIQVRTEDMHRAAEFGVAAHWIYKEKRTNMDSLDKKLGWIRQLMDESENLSDQDYIDSLKVNIYDGEIFVQTPKGKVLHLPDSAIPIDFAYMIHSDIGNKCVGAKINGQMKTITTPLNNGDIVEIITSQNSKGPSLDWLKKVKTLSARNKIRAYFKKEMKDENIKNGKSMLENASKSKGYPLGKLLENGRDERLLNRYMLSEFDEIYAAIGRGILSALGIINSLMTDFNKEISSNTLTIKDNSTQIKYKKNDSLVNVQDTKNLLINYAKCCAPVPGDDIIGYISCGRGVIIHRKSCTNVKDFDTNRITEVEWNQKEGGEFVATLNIVARNSSHTFQNISSKINDQKVNLKAFNTKKTIDDNLLITIEMIIKSKEELKQIITKLEATEDVIKIYR